MLVWGRVPIATDTTLCQRCYSRTLAFYRLSATSISPVQEESISGLASTQDNQRLLLRNPFHTHDSYASCSATMFLPQGLGSPIIVQDHTRSPPVFETWSGFSSIFVVGYSSRFSPDRDLAVTYRAGVPRRLLCKWRCRIDLVGALTLDGRRQRGGAPHDRLYGR